MTIKLLKCLVCILVTFQTASSSAYQSLDSIRSTASDLVIGSATVVDGDRKITVGQLDPRLRLADCGVALQAFYPNGVRRQGNTTVGVRCVGAKPWSIYVPVRIALMRDTAITVHPMARGETLTRAGLRLERRDISTIANGYFSSVEAALGRIVTRPLPAGAVLTPAAIASPRIIQRGDRVLLTADVGGISVRVGGQALMHGTLGDRVRVRNLSSQRVVEGLVLADGTIDIGL